MTLTNREIQVWNEISEWEDKLLQYGPTDFTALYDKWLEQSFSLLPENVQEQFFQSWIRGCFIYMLWSKVHRIKLMREIEFLVLLGYLIKI